LVPATALVALALSDFISGFVHWACDTWGSVDMPVLGPLFIRPFREHHVNAKSIVAHDFFEANGHNSLLGALTVSVALLLDAATFTGAAIGLTVALLGLFTAMTSQIHKWAHSEDPPGFVIALQRRGLMLSREHHDVHHTAPHDRNYCITVGWMNGPLARIDFFRRLERCVTAVTGIKPRQE